MQRRRQQTIEYAASLSGPGFFTGAHICIRFLPAEEDSGVVFQRIDLPGSPKVAAHIDNVFPCERRTRIVQDGVSVEMVEHVMAALAGLQIDNCLVQLNGPEPPGFDGSARPMVESLLHVGITEQSAEREVLTVGSPVCVTDGRGGSIVAEPSAQSTLAITYVLDYGPSSPIPAQRLTIDLTPQSFMEGLCFCRTFVLESEVAALQAQGIGRSLTARDLLVFGEDGVIENELRFPDECVRHKILDCVGDFALIGCDLVGSIVARRSGHQLNHDLTRQLCAFQYYSNRKAA